MKKSKSAREYFDICAYTDLYVYMCIFKTLKILTREIFIFFQINLSKFY